MKKVILVILSILFFSSFALAQDVYVNGYYRSDGTYVRPHYRSSPDGIKPNNYGSASYQQRKQYKKGDKKGTATFFETSDYKQDLGYITATEFTRQGKTIPEKLEKIGFTKHLLMRYYYLGNTEYFVFSDWRTKEREDVITWAVVDGEVKNYFKDIDGDQGEKIYKVLKRFT